MYVNYSDAVNLFYLAFITAVNDNRIHNVFEISTGIVGKTQSHLQNLLLIMSLTHQESAT